MSLSGGRDRIKVEELWCVHVWGGGQCMSEPSYQKMLYVLKKLMFVCLDVLYEILGNHFFVVYTVGVTRVFRTTVINLYTDALELMIIIIGLDGTPPFNL